MEIDVPETMAEVEKEVARRQANGETVTEAEVIKRTVLALFQAYLEFAVRRSLRFSQVGRRQY